MRIATSPQSIAIINGVATIERRAGDFLTDLRRSTFAILAGSTPSTFICSKKAYSARMKKSLKAALLSGLIFPGLGHMFLREYLRGTALLVTSLAALSIMVTRAYEQASLVVDRVLSGDVAIEAEAISQAVSNSTTAADSLVDNLLLVVLVACWLAGILDSYRLGATQERQDT